MWIFKIPDYKCEIKKDTADLKMDFKMLGYKSVMEKDATMGLHLMS